MLIGFIGSPCSGKTTTAAMTFADLKGMGLPSEYIAEQARLYIAERRVEQKLNPEDSLQLEDVDQYMIMRRQEQSEVTLTTACGPGTIVIADSSVLNALLYLSPEGRKQPGVVRLTEAAVKRYDLLFYCAPVKRPRNLDPNRIHNEEQSLAVDRLIPEVLREFAPDLIPIQLFGNPQMRHGEVTKALLKRVHG